MASVKDLQSFKNQHSEFGSRTVKQAVSVTDFTAGTVNGKQNYIRNLSIKNTVIYHTMSSKSVTASKE